MTTYSANLIKVWPSYLRHMTAAATYAGEYLHFHHSDCRNTQNYAYKTSSTAHLWHQPRPANDVWTWSWGLRGINPSMNSVWLAVGCLKFKNQRMKRNVGQNCWLCQGSVQVNHIPCSLPPVNGHYGLLHRSKETIRKMFKIFAFPLPSW